jgi:hypothetical protein
MTAQVLWERSCLRVRLRAAVMTGTGAFSGRYSILRRVSLAQLAASMPGAGVNRRLQRRAECIALRRRIRWGRTTNSSIGPSHWRRSLLMSAFALSTLVHGTNGI